jgi:hypothetical protein
MFHGEYLMTYRWRKNVNKEVFRFSAVAYMRVKPIARGKTVVPQTAIQIVLHKQAS